MPTVNSPSLVLIQQTVDTADVTLEVSYVGVFSPLERHLATHGLVFEEHISIIGEDMGVAADLTLHTLPPESIDVSAGTAPLRIQRRRTVVVRRESLDEDRDLMGHDEIDARIDILAIGLPSAIVTAMTPELSLSSDVTTDE